MVAVPAQHVVAEGNVLPPPAILCRPARPELADSQCSEFWEAPVWSLTDASDFADVLAHFLRPLQQPFAAAPCGGSASFLTWSCSGPASVDQLLAGYSVTGANARVARKSAAI